MITIEELKKSLGSKSTLLLSNFNDTEIEDLIGAQAKIISEILNELPSEIPQLLKKICSDFCKYELYQSEARQDVPEAIERQYNNGLKQLYKINKREISFGDEDAETLEAASYSVKDTYFGSNL